MSHFPLSGSIPPGWYPAVSRVETAIRSGDTVSFVVRWTVETPFGDIVTEDAEPFVMGLQERGLNFDGKTFERICRMLDAAGLQGQPIRTLPDITKLSGIKADVRVDVSGRVISVKPRGDNRGTEDSGKATET